MKQHFFDPRAFGLLEESFSAASADPSLWTAAMETAATITGASGAVLLPVIGRSIVAPHSQSMQASLETYISERWFERDERDLFLNLAGNKKVVVDHQFVSEDHIRKSSYYQDFLGKFDLRYFAGVRMDVNNEKWVLSIQRSADEGPFSPAEQLQLGRAAHRLTGALVLARSLSFSRAEGAFSAFELSEVAICMLDRSGLVWRHNAVADTLFGQGIGLIARRFVARDRLALTDLNEKIRRMLWSTEEHALSSPVVIRREGRGPIIAHVIKFAKHAMDVFAPSCAIVVLVDTDARRSASQRLLQMLFGLTPAEARLTVRLGTGVSIDRVSAEFGISQATARNQLKVVFSKTRTSRQGELVALISSCLSPAKT